jgi:esterase/lipase
MPAGAIGEIAVAGEGLSIGYYGCHEALNAEKFISNPFAEGRLFLTGDLGRYRHDGVIEHCGRGDSQIKIRGFRIEPAEIERCLNTFEGVRSALVHAPANEKLYAYYRVKRDASIDNASLMAHVRRQLPDFMVPQVIIELDDFPRLPNGKINRRALPDPVSDLHAHHVVPRTDTESQLAILWQKVLGGVSPSVYDNFVDAGGSSLSGMRFNAHVYRQFNTMISPRLLLTGNLAQIAAHLNPSDTADSNSDADRAEIEQIEPLFFGQSPQRLFGVLHKPQVRSRDRAILLVPSIGHEYMRLQRSYQMLATELSRLGFYVLRFDLSGFGDSEGEPSSVRVQRWQDDVIEAAQYLQSRSKAVSVTGVGVRLGAPVMVGAKPEFMDQMILWDPVCSGSPYLQHLDQLHRYAMRNLDRYRFTQRKSHPWERFGYTYSEQLANDIAALDIKPLVRNCSAILKIITSGDVVVDNDMDIQALLGMDGIDHQHEGGVNLWSDKEQASYLAFSQPILNRIRAIIASV